MTKTLTDKRSHSKLVKLMTQIGNIYDRAFPKKVAGEEFFREVDRIDLELTNALNKRPTTPAELDDAGKKAISEFVEACVQERAR